MNQERVQWLLIVVVLLGFLGFGFVLHQQSQMIERLSHQLSALPMNEGARPVMQEDKPADRVMPVQPITNGTRIQDIAVLPAPAAGLNRAVPNVQFIHRCVDGQVTTKRSDYNGRTLSFCVGRNQLIVRDNDQETILEDSRVMAAANAPLLMQVEAVANKPEDDSKLILISYSVEPCTTTDDCGVGGPNNFVSFLYDLNAHIGSRLSSFPATTYSQPVWNKAFSKALFYPKTCGGAGCYPAGLLAYDLRADKANLEVTRETAVTAAEAGPGMAMTAAEVPQSTWSQIEWTSESAFRAQVIDPSGKARWITGQF